MIISAVKAVYSKGHPVIAWEEGKDMRLIGRKPSGWVGGPYFSIRDCEAISEMGVEAIEIFESPEPGDVGLALAIRIDLT